MRRLAQACETKTEQAIFFELTVVWGLLVHHNGELSK